MSLFAVICQNMNIQRSHSYFEWVSDTDKDEVEFNHVLSWCLVLYKKGFLYSSLSLNRPHLLFSVGRSQASGQVSRGAEHRRNLPVVYQYWIGEMSPFHQR